MKQLSFGDAEGLCGRKRTRREVFLAEMDQVVPWAELVALIEPHYPKLGRPGRQPYPLATMLRIYFLQQWYALSDPALEEALIDTPVMRRFARIGGMEDIPDETTILNLRRLLERHGLAEKMFEQLNAHLERKGLRLRSGTIPAFARTDATIVSAPSSTKNRRRERDLRDAPDPQGPAVVFRDEGAHRGRCGLRTGPLGGGHGCECP